MLSAFALALLLSTAAEERGASLTHGLIGSYLAASVADYVSTQRCISAGTCREANPLLRPFADRPVTFGAVKAAAAVGVCAILITQHKRHPKAVRITAAALTAGTVYVAIRNIQIGRRVRG